MQTTGNAVTKEMFEHVGKNISQMEAIARPSITYWQDAWRRLKQNKVAMLGLIIIILYTIMAIVGPYMTPYDYRTTNTAEIDQPPSAKHWFGTDTLGRDLWARTWMGARVSLAIGFLAAFLNAVIGVIIGGISGYFGGKVDMFIMRTIDILYSIPYMIIVILMMVVLGQGIMPLVIAMVVVGWLNMARLVRGQVLQLKEQEFVLAAKVLGASHSRIIFKHLIPNALGVILVNLTMSVPSAIFTEAFLSFIGLGVVPPHSSWGQLAYYGIQAFRVRPYQLFIPAFFISTTMLSLNLLGDGLRDALDPRLRS
ncbi:ABC transporter permease [Thermosediminibacter litoriperuensis]|uniref:Oligopeptide transport system permease protein n=1 Tax=Thermosediminibacter litoriperuensis TaxID=291989 RepID=A0A5S5AUP6_9FIRM|nr:ABC transporter permease [Thermosediminibacter litoriperuensis]TYP56184.1 oligopeptide transport system permease protein [Thermosediminibacter litoriperuensis]